MKCVYYLGSVNHDVDHCNREASSSPRGFKKMRDVDIYTSTDLISESLSLPAASHVGTYSPSFRSSRSLFYIWSLFLIRLAVLYMAFLNQKSSRDSQHSTGHFFWPYWICVGRSLFVIIRLSVFVFIYELPAVYCTYVFHSRYSHLLLIAAHLDSLLILVERPDFKWGPESHKCLLDCYLLMTPSLLPSSTYNYYSSVLYTFQCSTYIVFLLFATYVKCMQEYSWADAQDQMRPRYIYTCLYGLYLAHIMIEKAKKLSPYGIQLCTMYYMNAFE